MMKREHIIVSLLLGTLISCFPQGRILTQEPILTTGSGSVHLSESNEPRRDIKQDIKEKPVYLSKLQEDYQQIEQDINEISNNIDTYQYDVQQTTWSQQANENDASSLLNTIYLDLSQLSKNKKELTKNIRYLEKNTDPTSSSVEDIISNSERLVLDSQKKIVENYEKAAKIYKLIAEQKKLDAEEQKAEWLSMREDKLLQAPDKLLHSAALYKQHDARMSQAKALEYVARIKQEQKGSDKISYYELQKKSENVQRNIHENQQKEFEKKQVKINDIKLEDVRKKIQNAGIETFYPQLFEDEKSLPKTPTETWFVLIVFVIFSVSTGCLFVMWSINRSNNKGKIAAIVRLLGNTIEVSCRLLPPEFRTEILLELKRQEENTTNNLQLLQMRINSLYSILFKAVPYKLWENIIYSNYGKFNK